MLRKHINSLPRQQLTKLPFYCWECLSIETLHRPIELVIKEEKDMDILLKFLIFTLRTIDGNRDSANDLIRRFKKKDREAMSTMNFDSVFLQQSVRSANSSFSRSKNAQKPQPTLDD